MLAKDPESADALFGYGQYLVSAGRTREAEEQLAALLSLQPDHKSALLLKKLVDARAASERGSLQPSYPWSDLMACDWRLGSLKGSAVVQLNLQGGSTKAGTITTTYPGGFTATRPATLSNVRASLHPPKLTWDFYQAVDNVSCDMNVVGSLDLVWDNCSHGGSQHCIRITDQVKADPGFWVSQDCLSPAACGPLTIELGQDALFGDRAKFLQWKQCLKDCMVNWCTQDLVSLLRCAYNNWPECADVDPPDGECDHLDGNPDNGEYVPFPSPIDGQSCESSIDCAGGYGLFCVSGVCSDPFSH